MLFFFLEVEQKYSSFSYSLSQGGYLLGCSFTNYIKHMQIHDFFYNVNSETVVVSICSLLSFLLRFRCLSQISSTSEYIAEIWSGES